MNWCVDRGQGYNASYWDRYQDCDKRARNRHLSGADRRDFLDWCADASQAYQQNFDTYWDRDRSCYTRANDRNLTGDSRRSFLRTCLSDYRAKQ